MRLNTYERDNRNVRVTQGKSCEEVQFDSLEIFVVSIIMQYNFSSNATIPLYKLISKINIQPGIKKWNVKKKSNPIVQYLWNTVLTSLVLKDWQLYRSVLSEDR